jgi:hypothetical protein
MELLLTLTNGQGRMWLLNFSSVLYILPKYDDGYTITFIDSSTMVISRIEFEEILKNIQEARVSSNFANA